MFIKEFIVSTLENFSISVAKYFLKKNDVVANLTTAETGKALDASMGKDLKTEIDELKTKLNTEIITGTLSAGETTLTISDPSITTDSILSFYTSIYGVNPLSVNVSNESVTLGFKAREEDMIVGVSVDG